MEKVFKSKTIYMEDEVINQAYLIIENGKFKEVRKNYEKEYLDYSDCLAIPGIIDIHSHGCMGYSATCKNKEELYGYTKALASMGVCGVFATTQELDSMSMIADVIDSNEIKGARILGIHSEGPFRHQKYMGASKGFHWPKPSVEYAKKMVESARGYLKYMSVSTDVEGIEEVMQYLLSQKIKIAAGHTDADFQKMKQGFQMGVTSMTHFGNAMRPIHQREGGCVVAGLLDKEIYLEIICDDVHLSSEIIDLYMAVKDYEHFILISDSSELAGMPKGRYFARGRERIVDEEGHIKIHDGTISGSGKCVLFDMKNLIFKHHLPILNVLAMGSLQPAKYFGIDEIKGSIQINKDADFVILDQDWHVVETYVEGIKQFDVKKHENLINPLMKNLDKNDLN